MLFEAVINMASTFSTLSTKVEKVETVEIIMRGWS
jgi:hypothetical protein